MKQALNPYIAIPIAVFALIVSWVLWYTFVRPVPEKIAEGTIVARYFREKTKVKKEIPRISRNLEHMSQKIEYTLPDRFIYDIQLNGIDKLTHFSIPLTAT